MSNTILQSKEILQLHHVRKIVAKLRKIVKELRTIAECATKPDTALLKALNEPGKATYLNSVKHSRDAKNYSWMIEATAEFIEQYTKINRTIDAHIIQCKLAELNQNLIGTRLQEKIAGLVKTLSQTMLLPSFLVTAEQIIESMPPQIRQIPATLGKFIKNKQLSFFKNDFSKIEIQLASEAYIQIYQAWFCEEANAKRYMNLVRILMTFKNELNDALINKNKTVYLSLLRNNSCELEKIINTSLDILISALFSTLPTKKSFILSKFIDEPELNIETFLTRQTIYESSQKLKYPFINTHLIKDKAANIDDTLRDILRDNIIIDGILSDFLQELDHMICLDKGAASKNLSNLYQKFFTAGIKNTALKDFFLHHLHQGSLFEWCFNINRALINKYIPIETNKKLAVHAGNVNQMLIRAGEAENEIICISKDKYVLIHKYCLKGYLFSTNKDSLNMQEINFPEEKNILSVFLFELSDNKVNLAQSFYLFPNDAEVTDPLGKKVLFSGWVLEAWNEYCLTVYPAIDFSDIFLKNIQPEFIKAELHTIQTSITRLTPQFSQKAASYWKEIYLQCEKIKHLLLRNKHEYETQILKFTAKILIELRNTIFQESPDKSHRIKELGQVISDIKERFKNLIKEKYRSTPDEIWQHIGNNVHQLKSLPNLDDYFEMVIECYNLYLTGDRKELLQQKDQTIKDWKRQRSAIGSQYYTYANINNESALVTPAGHKAFSDLLNIAGINDQLLRNFIYVTCHQHCMNFIEDFLKYAAREDNSVNYEPKYELVTNYLEVQPPYYIKRINDNSIRLCLIIQSSGMQSFNNGRLLRKDIEPTLVLYCEFFTDTNPLTDGRMIRKGKSGYLTFNDAPLKHATANEIASSKYFVDLLPAAIQRFHDQIYYPLKSPPAEDI